MSEKVTPNDVNLADSWIDGLPVAVALDQRLDPFTIVPYQQKRHKQQARGSASRKPISTSVSEGEISQLPSHTEQGIQAAANSILTAISQHHIGRDGVQRYIFYSNPALNQNSHDADKESPKIPIRNNPRENGLRQYPCLREKKKKEEAKNRIYHITFCTSAATKLIYGFFTLVSFTRNFSMPSHRKNP